MITPSRATILPPTTTVRDIIFAFLEIKTAMAEFGIH
jgi:hypothetical protein